jgi:hypothetical protein
MMTANLFPMPKPCPNNRGFYRDKIRAGYRAPYLKELAQRVASGNRSRELAHQRCSASDLLKEMKTVKGVVITPRRTC